MWPGPRGTCVREGHGVCAQGTLSPWGRPRWLGLHSLSLLTWMHSAGAVRSARPPWSLRSGRAGAAGNVAPNHAEGLWHRKDTQGPRLKLLVAALLDYTFVSHGRAHGGRAGRTEGAPQRGVPRIRGSLAWGKVPWLGRGDRVSSPACCRNPRCSAGPGPWARGPKDSERSRAQLLTSGSRVGVPPGGRAFHWALVAIFVPRSTAGGLESQGGRGAGGTCGNHSPHMCLCSSLPAGCWELLVKTVGHSALRHAADVASPAARLPCRVLNNLSRLCVFDTAADRRVRGPRPQLMCSQHPDKWRHQFLPLLKSHFQLRGRDHSSLRGITECLRRKRTAHSKRALVWAAAMASGGKCYSPTRGESKLAPRAYLPTWKVPEQ